MRRSAYLILINAMILIVVMALMTQSLFIVKRLAQVENVQGQVMVRHEATGTLAALTSKDFIKTNDVVITGADGHVELKWSDGTRLKMEPDSDLAIKTAAYNVTRKADESRFQLNRGTIFVRLTKTLAPRSKFEITTPTATAAVRGTIFMVKVESGKTEVAVHKGAVQVTSGHDDQIRESYITPGKIAVSKAEGQVDVECHSPEGAAIEAQFAACDSIVKPELRASIRKFKDGERALIKGRTEPGDTVTVNDQPVTVLGNGAFLYRVSLQKGTNQYTVVSTDKHGGTSRKVLSVSERE